jgi:hypothetical protein
LIRHLVTEFHMPYRDVLELTPLQAIALVTPESDPPGLLQSHTRLELINSIKEIYKHGW